MLSINNEAPSRLVCNYMSVMFCGISYTLRMLCLLSEARYGRESTVR